MCRDEDLCSGVQVRCVRWASAGVSGRGWGALTGRGSLPLQAPPAGTPMQGTEAVCSSSSSPVLARFFVWICVWGSRGGAEGSPSGTSKLGTSLELLQRPAGHTGGRNHCSKKRHGYEGEQVHMWEVGKHHDGCKRGRKMEKKKQICKEIIDTVIFHAEHEANIKGNGDQHVLHTSHATKSYIKWNRKWHKTTSNLFSMVLDSCRICNKRPSCFKRKYPWRCTLIRNEALIHN